MSTQSLWLTEHESAYPSVESSREYDVIVVGGGITGVTSAYFLKMSGLRVCLLEKGKIAGGETGHTSAHLTMVTDRRFNSLVSAFGDDAATLTWKAGAAAIELIEWIVNQQKIDCDFQRIPAFLLGDFLGDTKDEFYIERDAVYTRDQGFDTYFVPRAPLFGRPAVGIPNQARFHPVKFVTGLAEKIPGNGSDVFENSEVSEISGEQPTVIANGISLKANKVVIATHVPLSGKANPAVAAAFQTRLTPYSTYVIAAPISEAQIPDALFWDTRDPYRYLRIETSSGTTRAILGGADHKTGQKSHPVSCFDELTDILHHIIPGAMPDYNWSGQVIETNDGLPYIGEIAENQFIATGYAGNGLTFGVVAATMANDFALGRKSPWGDLFGVSRSKVLGGTWRYLTENLDYPFYFIKDLLTPVDREDPRALAAGTGKVLKIDGETVACARDDDGTLHQCSAKCTHMGCLVRWNDAEKTWDCPCHGSRFSMEGDVISGPAEKPLEAFHPKSEKITH